MIKLDDQPVHPLDSTPRAESSPTSKAIHGSVHKLPRRVPTLTNSPGCAPQSTTLNPNAPRRVRTVRVDAWAVPAAASWSRTRASVRKVSRKPRPTDSAALPF